LAPGELFRSTGLLACLQRIPSARAVACQPVVDAGLGESESFDYKCRTLAFLDALHGSDAILFLCPRTEFSTIKLLHA